MRQRIAVTMHSINEATVHITPGWFHRVVLGRPSRQFRVERAAAQNGGHRWWCRAERSYLKPSRITAELHYAWWVFDKAERVEAVKQTFGNRLAAQRQRVRAELGLDG